MKIPKCVNYKCEREDLQEVEAESTWTMKKFFCPKCGKAYGVPTNVGKVAQVSGIVTAAVILSNFALNSFGHFLGIDDIDVGVDTLNDNYIN